MPFMSRRVWQKGRIPAIGCMSSCWICSRSARTSNGTHCHRAPLPSELKSPPHSLTLPQTKHSLLSKLMGPQLESKTQCDVNPSCCLCQEWDTKQKSLPCHPLSVGWMWHHKYNGRNQGQMVTSLRCGQQLSWKTTLCQQQPSTQWAPLRILSLPLSSPAAVASASTSHFRPHPT